MFALTTLAKDCGEQLLVKMKALWEIMTTQLIPPQGQWLIKVTHIHGSSKEHLGFHGEKCW